MTTSPKPSDKGKPEMPPERISVKERYEATFRHQEPDRIPILLDAHVPFYQSGTVQWRNQLERAEILKGLGCDPIIEIWLPDPVPHPDVKIKTWREYRPGEKLPCITKEYHTPAGVLRQVVRETEDWVSPGHAYWVRRTLGPGNKLTYGLDLFDDWNIPRQIEPWVKGPDDLDKLAWLLQMPAGEALAEWRMDAIRAKEYAARHALPTMSRRTIIGDAFMWFCNAGQFMMDILDNPDFVKAFFEIFREFARWQAELALDIGVDVFQYRGCYETSEFWGGGRYEAFLVPLIQEQAAMAHDAGSLFCYFMTKGHSDYLDHFEKMDIDAHFGVDPVMGGVDLREMKSRIGGKTTIIGGVNSELTMSKGTPREVEEATRQAIEVCSPGGGFVLAPVIGIYGGIPWANVETLIRTAHESR